MFNKKHLILGLLSVSVFSSGLYAEEYTGTVTPLKVIQHGAGTNAYFYGYLKYAARLGEIAIPSITNSKGEIVHEGTVLWAMDKQYWQEQLKGAQDEVAGYIVALEEAKANYKRYSELIKTNATSEEIYEGYIGEMASCYNNLAQAQGNVVQFQEFLKITDFVSPFEGIISKVMYSQGVTAENEPVFEITQLNPICIDVAMSREEARKLGHNTPVKIIPENGTPQGILYGRTLITDSGVRFLTLNSEDLPGAEKDTIIHRDWFPVLNFSIDGSDVILTVPQSSWLEDARGKYVWKAKSVELMEPGKGYNNKFSIEKVYINLTGLHRESTGFSRIWELKEPGNLKLYDLILVNPPATLKEGDIVYMPPERYNLMPGDQVKVVVGN